MISTRSFRLSLRLFFSIWALVLPISLLLSSCQVKADEPSVEDMIKGHEEWARALIVLRLGRMHPSGQYVEAYQQRHNDILPVYQTIDLRRSAGETGSITYYGDRKAFDVIKGKDLYYTLEMRYYNDKKELMNYQFLGYFPDDIEGSMLPIHQHFFQIMNVDRIGKFAYPTHLDGRPYEEFTYLLDESGQKQEETAPNYKESDPYKRYRPIHLKGLSPRIFNFTYRDTDPIELTLGEKYTDPNTKQERTVDFLRQKRSLDPADPLDRTGLKGWFQFVHPDIAFQMQLTLVHITVGSKYIGKGPDKLLEFYERHDAWTVTDINIKIPFRVIADADGSPEQCAQDIAKHTGGSAERIRPALFEGGMSLDPNFRM